MTKKLSQEFNRTESRVSGALSKLDEYLLNRQIRVQSESVPETSRYSNRENEGTNEDGLRNDSYFEVGVFLRIRPRRDILHQLFPIFGLIKFFGELMEISAHFCSHLKILSRLRSRPKHSIPPQLFS